MQTNWSVTPERRPRGTFAMALRIDDAEGMIFTCTHDHATPQEASTCTAAAARARAILEPLRVDVSALDVVDLAADDGTYDPAHPVQIPLTEPPSPEETHNLRTFLGRVAREIRAPITVRGLMLAMLAAAVLGAALGCASARRTVLAEVPSGPTGRCAIEGSAQCADGVPYTCTLFDGEGVWWPTTPLDSTGRPARCAGVCVVEGEGSSAHASCAAGGVR